MQSKPSNDQTAAMDETDEPDEWDKRIIDSGCADENTKMGDCWHRTKDWRQCKDEMLAFRKCWNAHHDAASGKSLQQAGTNNNNNKAEK